MKQNERLPKRTKLWEWGASVKMDNQNEACQNLDQRMKSKECPF